MPYRVLLWGVVVGLLVCAIASADIPKTINFQGRLTDASGKFVSDGKYYLSFRLYSDSTGGTAIWQEAESIAVSKGLFNVILGSFNPIPDSIFDYSYIWLGMQVGSDQEMTPRQRLSSLGYAYRSIKADTSAFAVSGIAGGWVDDGTVVRLATSTDNVGIGTTSPLTSLHVARSGGYHWGSGTGRGWLTIGDSTYGLSFGIATGGLGAGDARIWTDGGTGRLMISGGSSSRDLLTLTNGNVGIGTNNPRRKLEIDLSNASGPWGRDAIYIRSSDDNSTATLLTNKNNFTFWTLTEGVDRRANISCGDIDADGTTTTKVLAITGGSDLAEPFPISYSEKLQAGSAVIIDEENPGHLTLSSQPYDRRVAGIVSGAGGIKPGLTLSQEGVMEGDQNIALSGRVYVLATASNGAIKPGDLLTTSSIPGYVMKVTDYEKAQGAIIGKAMSPLDKGQGLVLVLVNLQ